MLLRTILETIRVLLQINAGNDPAKFGEDIDNAPALLECALSKKYIKVEGLMTIPPISENTAETAHFFSNMYKYFIDISAKKLDNVNMNCVIGWTKNGDKHSFIDDYDK